MYAWIYQPGQQLCKRNDRKEKPPLLASVYARIDQPFSVRCPALVTLSLENAQVPVDGSPSFGLDDKRENYTSLIVISIINDLYHLINLTSMPSVRCPRCGKKFKDQTSLLQHMNQPISSCLTHFEERIDIATALQSDPTISESDESDDMGRQSFEAPDFMDTAEDLLLASESYQNPEDPKNPFIIKKHPTSGSVYGRGETFMDQCDKDRFTEMRKGCLYYPFASREEWELASFLLRSRLSMAALDRFLKLELASYTSKFIIYSPC